MLYVNGQFDINTEISCGDKSVSHRALLFASVAEGNSVIRNLSRCQDVAATADCLRKLGADIVIKGDTAYVSPIKRPNDGVVLDCKNSGTTARLLAGLVAGLGVKAKFIGDGSLSSRPMERVLRPLEALGAKFGRCSDGLFESRGGRLAGTTVYAEVNSAQVKSAVLIAGLFADGQTTFVEKLPTRNHTELMMRSLGVDITTADNAVTVKKSAVAPLNLTIPNDPSSVAFLLALAMLTDKEVSFDNVLLNERRLGAVSALIQSGANLSTCISETVYGESVSTLYVGKSRLKPLDLSPQDVCDAIDEIPLLATIALRTRGKHVFRDVGELRNKESDRINAIVRTAEACGQRAEFDGRDLAVFSDGKSPEKPRFVSFGDHRVAMSQTVLALACGGGSVDGTPFEVSFPDFLQSAGVRPLKLGLIGENVSDSMSPVLMEYLARKADVCCSYETVTLPRDVSDERLAEVINGFDGLNVTMPFKRRAAELTRASERSVNTLGKNIAPLSTDGHGIIKPLTVRGIDLTGKPVWIVGAGGAAETCVTELLKRGCKIRILNRTSANADVLTEKYGLVRQMDEPYGVLSFVPECDFEKSIVLPQSVKFVFVADYKGRSGILEQAVKRGLPNVHGLEMLFHQGAKSFSLWTDTPLQDDFDGFTAFLRENNVL